MYRTALPARLHDTGLVWCRAHLRPPLFVLLFVIDQDEAGPDKALWGQIVEEEEEPEEEPEDEKAPEAEDEAAMPTTGSAGGVSAAAAAVAAASRDEKKGTDSVISQSTGAETPIAVPLRKSVRMQPATLLLFACSID